MPSRDSEHLRTLSICHYVVAGLSMFGIGFLLLHYMIVKTVFATPQIWKHTKEPMPFSPQEFLAFFQWFYLFMGLFILAAGILTLMSGRCLGRRVNRTFSIVVAGLNCLFFPFGTILGVFTIIVLTRDSVAQLYVQSEPEVN